MKNIIAIIFFCLLLAICTVLYKPLFKNHIENDLYSKTTKILTDAGHDPSRVTLNGHNLEIPAELAKSLSDETYNELDCVIGLYIIETNELDPEPKPAQMMVKQDPQLRITENHTGSITVSGRVPDQHSYQAIISAVTKAAVNNRVIDKINIDTNTCKFPSLSTLEKLIPSHITSADLAEIHYTPKTLILLGNLDNSTQEETLISLANPLINEESILVNKLKVIPFEPIHFRAERKAGKLILTGVLPSKAEQLKLLVLTNKGASGTTIIDKTTIAEKPAPNYWWSDHPQTFISNHFKNTKGPAYVEYTPKVFNANGIYSVEDEYKDAQQKLSDLPQQITQEIGLVYKDPKPAPTPQPTTIPQPTPKTSPQSAPAKQKLAIALKQLPIYFNTSSDYLKPSELLKIKIAVEVLNDNSNDIRALTITGFADTRGDADVNKSLSLKRANAVRKQLIKLGIKANILSVQHFGEDVSNMDQSNLWKARRVEVSLQP